MHTSNHKAAAVALALNNILFNTLFREIRTVHDEKGVQQADRERPNKQSHRPEQNDPTQHSEQNKQGWNLHFIPNDNRAQEIIDHPDQ